MNRLRKLSKYGQSYWMDDLSRDILANGSLEKQIRDRDLKGITSNPAIQSTHIANATRERACWIIVRVRLMRSPVQDSAGHGSYDRAPEADRNAQKAWLTSGNPALVGGTGSRSAQPVPPAHRASRAR